MKRIIAIVITLMVLVALTVPAVANAQDVDTEAVVGGTGNPPFVCAKFETPDDDPAPGTQISPIPEGMKTVKFYVVVGDPNGVDDIAAVYVKVFHPDGSFKFQLDAIRPTWNLIPWTGMIDMDGDCTGDTPVEMALDALEAQGRITYGAGWDLDTVKYDIEHGKQLLVELVGEMHYHQPAGMYRVEAWAADAGGNAGVKVENFFEYLSIVALKIDFSAINWGNINICSYNVLYGDENMATPDRPTVQNVGNDPANLVLHATALTGVVDGKKIEEFDVDLLGTHLEFLACVDTTIPVVLPPCTPTQIDFSVHPPYGTPADLYLGTMTVTIVHAGGG